MTEPRGEGEQVYASSRLGRVMFRYVWAAHVESPDGEADSHGSAWTRAKAERDRDAFVDRWVAALSDRTEGTDD